MFRLFYIQKCLFPSFLLYKKLGDINSNSFLLATIIQKHFVYAEF